MLIQLLKFEVNAVMGLARMVKKRRKTIEKKSGEVNASSSGSSEKDESSTPADWWDEFHKRINGNFHYALHLLHCSVFHITFASSS